MNREQFLKQRRPAWKAFEKRLFTQHFSSWDKPTSESVLAFGRELREMAFDLEQVRTRDWGLDLEEYLNRLLTRGHDLFHASRSGSWRNLGKFLFDDFPKTFRKWWFYQLLALILFGLPMAIGWVLIQTEPALASRVMSAETLEQYDMMYSSEETDEQDPEDMETVSSWETWNQFGDERATMAGFYVQHNVGIALQCFARGILAGIGTIYTLIFNGISIGATAGYVLSLGHGERFLSFVVSHGAFELTALVIAGAAGLLIGDALLHPNQSSYWSSLKERAEEAGQLIVGAAVMLIIAAMIEAFWSPAPIPPIYKFIGGGCLWLVVIVYLTMSGRQTR